MLRARDVCHRFGTTQVLRNVNLEAEPGTMLGLAGQNGAGKSTLLHILCGHLVPTSGTVQWDGLERCSPQFRAAVVLASQDRQLDPEITGRETLELFTALCGGGSPVPLLSHDLDKRVASYSGGMKRRLHLMVTSMWSPRVLGLDEPAAGLDAEGRDTLWSWVRRLVDGGATVIVASHRLPPCDQVLELPR